MIKFSFLTKEYRIENGDVEAMTLLLNDRHPGTPAVKEKQLIELTKGSYTAIARDMDNGKIIGMAVLGIITRLEGKKGFICKGCILYVVVAKQFRFC